MKEIKVKSITLQDDGADIPANLKKFVDPTTGELDASKLVQSYGEAEKKVTEESQKRSDAERAYQILADGYVTDDGTAGGAGDGGDTGTGRKPAKAASDEPLRQSDARPVVKAVLEISHPELATDPATGKIRDQKFLDEFKAYAVTLHPAVKQLMAQGDYESIDWAVRQFKAFKGSPAARAKSGSPGAGDFKPNFVEGGSNATDATGKVWTKAEIRQLQMKNPAEYAKLADTEIAQAYAEGRVKE